MSERSQAGVDYSSNVPHHDYLGNGHDGVQDDDGHEKDKKDGNDGNYRDGNYSEDPQSQSSSSYNDRMVRLGIHG
jgi:hypothetical protein